MIPIIAHSGKGKMMETVKISVVARGWGQGEMNRWNTQDFQDITNTLYDSIMMETCHYTLVQMYTQRMYNTKSESLWTLGDYDVSNGGSSW